MVRAYPTTGYEQREELTTKGGWHATLSGQIRFPVHET